MRSAKEGDRHTLLPSGQKSISLYSAIEPIRSPKTTEQGNARNQLRVLAHSMGFDACLRSWHAIVLYILNDNCKGCSTLSLPCSPHGSVSFLFLRAYFPISPLQ